MNSFTIQSWVVVRSFLFSMGIFQVLLFLLFLSQGFSVALVSATIAPLLPLAFVFHEWRTHWHGNDAIYIMILFFIVAATAWLAIRYPNKFLVIAAHALLIVYWTVCLGVLGNEFT
jgi:hypothetical protein